VARSILHLLVSLFVLVGLAASAFAQDDTQQTPAPADDTAVDQSGEPGPVRIGDYVATGAIEIGWRFTDLDGSEALYRSQVDLPRGPTLAFSRVELRSPDNTGLLFDHLLVEGSGWGGEPNSSARVRAARRGLYVVDYTNRRIDNYNFVPDFANPLFADGALVAPHGWDRTRELQSLYVTLFPERRIEGHFSFDRSRQTGLGLGTDVSSDTLIFNRDLDNRSHEVRGGVAFRWPRWFLSLDQGLRVYDDDELDTANSPAVSDPETLANFTRRRTTDWEAPTSRATLTAEPIDRLRLTARVVYTDYDVSGSLVERLDAIGSDPATSDITGDTSGTAFLFDSQQSYRFLGRVTVSNWARYRRYRNSGANAGVFTFNDDLESAVRELDDRSYRDAVFSDQPQVEVEVMRGLTARVAYRFAHRESFFERTDTVLVPTTIDQPPFPTVTLSLVKSRRYDDDYRMDALLAGGSYRLRHDARLFVEYENGREPSTFFGSIAGNSFSGIDGTGTFFNTIDRQFFDRPGDYQLLRVRGLVRPAEWVEVGGSVRTTDRTFPSGPLLEAYIDDPETGRAPLLIEPPLQQSRLRAASATLRLTPDPRLLFGVTYDHVHSTAGITYLRSIEQPDGGFAPRIFYQRYLGNEELVTADVTAYPTPRLTLYGLYSMISSAGTVPVHYHQAHLRGMYLIGRGVSGVLEWRLYDYDDHRYSVTDYRANHAVVGLRWEF
jgi:hypothetical protein